MVQVLLQATWKNSDLFAPDARYGFAFMRRATLNDGSWQRLMGWTPPDGIDVP